MDSTQDTPSTDAKRISITLIPKAITAVDRLVASHGMTKADAVNRGVQLYDFLETERAAGRRIALIDGAGNVERLTFF